MELKLKETSGHAGGIIRWVVEDASRKQFGEGLFMSKDSAETLVKIMVDAHEKGYEQAQFDIRAALGTNW